MGLDEFSVDRQVHNQHTKGVSYTDEGIKTAIKELADELGRTPTFEEATQLDEVPGISAICKRYGSWNKLLKQLDLEINEVREYSDKDKISIIHDAAVVYRENGGQLNSRLYEKHGNYSYKPIDRLFGSWNSFMSELGIDTNKNHGKRIESECGYQLDSQLEKQVDEALHSLNIEHQVHKTIPNTQFKSDFYITDLNLWVEVDGYWKDTRPNHQRWSEKLALYSERNLEFIVVNSSDTLVSILQ
jgi:hypothetical protein